MAEEVRAKRGTFEEKLEVGSQEKPIGVTIYDEDTKEPYCTKIKGGISIVLPGKCDAGTDIDENGVNLIK